MLQRLHAGDELRNNIAVNFPNQNWTDASAAGFRRIIYLSQLGQAECLRYVVDGGRFAAARPQGYLFWQLNDIWQASSWGSLDYGGRWRLLQYRARHFFAPVYAACNTEQNFTTLVCSAVNDDIRAAAVQATISIISAATGHVQWSQPATANLAAGQTSTLVQLDLSAVLPTINCTAASCLGWLSIAGGPATPAPLGPLAALALGPAALTLTVQAAGVTVSNAGPGPALHVMVTTAAPGHFTDNGVSLLPGQRATLFFQAHAALNQTLFAATIHLAQLGPGSESVQTLPAGL